jgi:uncharacterized protein (TIGR02118 family)
LRLARIASEASLFLSGADTYNPRLAAMIKLVYCIAKKSELTDQEFFDYWRNIHAPIGARIPGVRRFIQSRRLSIPGDKNAGDFDGMVELWFDDVEALLAARRSPEWQASTADEGKFIDHSKVAYFVSEEHVIFDITIPRAEY